MNPHLIRLLPLLLWLVDVSKAAPIRDTSTASNWLACLAALLVFSAVCLLTFKLLFLRYRRKSTLRGPRPVVIGNSYVNRYVHVSKSCKKSTKCKAGFLVGFAGSPTFETGFKPSEITLVYAHSDSSKGTTRHDLSLETTTSNKTKRSVGSLIGPVILFKEQQWATKEKLQDKTQSLTHSKSYFTLPRQFSLDLGRIRRKKQPTASESEMESLPWPHNLLQHATHHMVKLYSESEKHANKCEDTNKPTLPLQTSSNGLEISLSEECRQPTPVSPLLILPDQGQHLRSDIPSLHPETRSPPSQICHPYSQPSVTFLKPAPGRYTRRASHSPSLSVIEEYCQSNGPDFVNELGFINYSLPRSPLLDHNQGHRLSDFSVTPVKSPPTAHNGYGSLRRRDRVKASSIRSRRSPPLGPSPLRSMILPDPTNGSRDIENNNPVTARHSRTARNSYKNLGLGLPSIALTGVEEGGKRTSAGTVNMVDFLRELAEETKDWDESIALDEGFKSMIQQTKPVSGPNNDSVEEGCSTSTPTTPSNKYKDKRRSPPPFVSFWLEDTPSS